MNITIDTTHPLNDRDRAILRALLDATPALAATASPRADAAPGPRPGSAAAIASAIADPSRKPDSVIASAKRPVASQPGVSLTESTTEQDPHAG